MCIFARWKINNTLKKVKSMQLNRVHNQPSDEVLKKEIGYYSALATRFMKLEGHKKFPYARIMLVEAYRAAAVLDDANAHFQLGKLFLDEAKYRQHIQTEGVLASPGNLKTSRQLYEESLAHLQAAEKLGHIAAKRLKGLCYINGWGVTTDRDAGFEMVVASIEQEGSWDKIPQIFAEIGLNKPEFFTAILQRKKK